MIALADNPTTDRAVAALAELSRASGPAPQRSAAASRRFGYDEVVEDNDRRKPPAANTTSEDDLLTPSKRKKLTGAARDIHRNFAIAGWAIRKHLDYVSTFGFQSRTGIKDLDDLIEALMAWWGRPRNCDVAGRHSLGRLIRLAEARRTVDADVFLMKLSDGQLQAVEGMRPEAVAKGALSVILRRLSQQHWNGTPTTGLPWDTYRNATGLRRPGSARGCALARADRLDRVCRRHGRG